jgi:hypothetical protein
LADEKRDIFGTILAVFFLYSEVSSFEDEDFVDYGSTLHNNIAFVRVFLRLLAFDD